ncbi:AAA family ATPase [Treponema primitia]|uniref:AAA family ATPase n=1 Tax=Treponema primitia TaxID=88058 RepID=UPI000255564E|nr:MoxR family ATPase [Treponema primitia]
MAQLNLDVSDTEALLAGAQKLLDSCREELAKRVIGQREMIDGLLMALIARGHILLEGVPGLAKTLAVKSLAEITGLDFKRIQFTPDLLPADVTGTLVWEQATGKFSVRRGPVFANVILADEINRAPAKVQSALLEAMEEHQVTIGEESYPLPDPFFVLATQNPIEHEGTYTLPEAELDRFLLKLLVRYPSPEEELRILNPHNSYVPTLKPILGPSQLESLRTAAEAIRIDDKIGEYIVSVVSATRPSAAKPASARSRGGSRPAEGAGSGRAGREGLYRYISFGASPRASIALYRCCRILALFNGRLFVTPEDVKTAALPVLRHRIVLSYEAEADGLDPDAVVSRILAFVPVP